MTARAPKPCSKPGCNALVYDGSARCDKHKPPKWTKRADSPKRITGRKLQRMRDELFKAQPLCVECLKHGRLTPATERDHIMPLFEGGTDTDDNVQALCHDCHEIKSKAERIRARQAGLPVPNWPRSSK